MAVIVPYSLLRTNRIPVMQDPAEEMSQAPAAPEVLPLQQLGDYRLIRTVGLVRRG